MAVDTHDWFGWLLGHARQALDSSGPKNGRLFMLNEDITLRKLEILWAFIKTGNMSKTATELNLTPVAVYKALHSLEESMRCPLFQKKGRQLIALPNAVYLAEASMNLILDLNKTINRVRERAGYSSTSLRLGAMYSLTANLIPQIIVGTKTRRPELNIDLVLGSSADLLDKLIDHNIDAVVMALQSDDIPRALQFIPLFEDHLFLASPKSAAVQKSGKVDLTDYQKEKFVALQDGFATTNGFYEAFRRAKFEPKVVMRVGDIFSLMHLVSGGIGHSLLPARVKGLMGDAIHFRELKEQHAIKQLVGLIFLKSKERNPNILALAAEARMVLRRAKKST